MALLIENTEDPRQLSQAMIQIIDSLNMYHAELARVLHLQCNDVGQLSSGQQLLKPGSDSWRQAKLFLSLYQSLYQRFDGEGAGMIHWMRSSSDAFGSTPHLMIVDEDRLVEVVAYLDG